MCTARSFVYEWKLRGFWEPQQIRWVLPVGVQVSDPSRFMSTEEVILSFSPSLRVLRTFSSPPWENGKALMTVWSLRNITVI
jgi:hypothetical protein